MFTCPILSMYHSPSETLPSWWPPNISVYLPYPLHVSFSFRNFTVMVAAQYQCLPALSSPCIILLQKLYRHGGRPISVFTCPILSMYHSPSETLPSWWPPNISVYLPYPLHVSFFFRNFTVMMAAQYQCLPALSSPCIILFQKLYRHDGRPISVFTCPILSMYHSSSETLPS